MIKVSRSIGVPPGLLVLASAILQAGTPMGHHAKLHIGYQAILAQRLGIDLKAFGKDQKESGP
jgi:hypothetical protein